MRELSLFTGAGGGLLGTHLLGWTPVGYVEFNDYCQQVIRQRIIDGFIPNAPIFGDIQTFISSGYAASYTGLVDVVTGGFPCQPFSNAGKQAGADDLRNMWPATIECLRIIRPRYALLENVPGLVTSGYFGTILGDLAEGGFDCRWRILSAAEMGAPHKRDRLWIVAYANGGGLQNGWRKNSQSLHEERNGWHADSNISAEVAQSSGVPGDATYATSERTRRLPIRQGRPQQNPTDVNGLGEDVSDSNESRLAQWEGGAEARRTRTATDGRDWWAVEPDVGRVVNGLAYRVDRLRAIGNGQVPAVAATAWRLLINS